MRRRSWKKTVAATATAIALTVPTLSAAQTQVAEPPPAQTAPAQTPPAQSPPAPAAPAAPNPPAPDPAVPIELDVTPGAIALPTETVQQAIAHELGVPVVTTSQATGGPRSGGHLRISLDGDRRIVLSFRDANNREVIRLLAQPDDPNALLSAIVLLAGNLARNQVDDIIADLTPVGGPTSVAPTAAVVPAAVTPTPAAVTPTPAVVPAVPVIAPALQAPPRPPYDMRAGILRRRFSLGLDGYVTAVSIRNAHQVFAFAGVSFSFAVHPNIAIGLNHFTVSAEGNESGTRVAVTAGPFVELRGLLGKYFQPFAQVGVPFQSRSGGGIDTALGVAAYAGGGMRFRLGEAFSLGVGARAYTVFTHSFMASGGWLPQGAVSLSGGGELNFHF